MDAHEREPCPDRIVDDLGGAFSFGAVGGALFYSFKGARNAPRGERTAGAVQAVKANARRLGGSFAVWGGLFSTFDCCMIAIRNKEDPYNSIIAGFCTGASLAARGGANAAFKSGLVGGILLGVIEGMNIALTRIMAKMPPPEPLELQESVDGEAAVQTVEVPWWAKWFQPAPPKEEVDFSDPQEMAASPAFGKKKDDYSASEAKWTAQSDDNKKWNSPLEPQLDTKALFMLIRGHTFAAQDADSKWRHSLVHLNSRQ
mmetsp:Transcript_41448/g.84746  ORF Transcript_41448/g.84746 Transcript_41448/m.84746 type:complete len:258 (-) Transcript_41448:340-1113(-)|eukprot:CAMPEP_0181301382 /NCGR_PEP_ID=MMETSP1101-20121128/7392_1 /TAXON_ID=46948 /ORGANISM="Rhodomonas abbreviata, Strain Caron Lab Isolate" /LENGTH=257 /DNA_ID=CAMNT_0023406679 /DNA_START=309 /DNA_END=1082 /DNA_ORIENTATION=+